MQYFNLKISIAAGVLMGLIFSGFWIMDGEMIFEKIVVFSLLIGFFSAVSIGLILSLVSIKSNRKIGTIKAELAAGENTLLEGKARLISESKSDYGLLVLTDKRIIFIGNSDQNSIDQSVISLKEIESVKLQMNLAFLSWILLIQVEDGTYSYFLDFPKEWKEIISDFIYKKFEKEVS